MPSAGPDGTYMVVAAILFVSVAPVVDLPTELAERMIAISAEEMRTIPEVIVIPYGIRKAPAVRAALRSGLVGGIVTHATLAKAVLDGT